MRKKKRDSEGTPRAEPWTFEKMMETGLGLCGFDPVSFYNMTLPELVAAANGKMHMLELQQRNNWECARFLATTFLQPHARKGKRIKPKDIAIFPWEEKGEIEPEELREQLLRYNGTK